jgi:hypothetical protein
MPKLRIEIEVDVSKTLAETMKRTGFIVCNDGSAMQVKIPNSPAIPKRKTQIVFVDEQVAPSK